MIIAVRIISTTMTTISSTSVNPPPRGGRGGKAPPPPRGGRGGKPPPPPRGGRKGKAPPPPRGGRGGKAPPPPRGGRGGKAPPPPRGGREGKAPPPPRGGRGGKAPPPPRGGRGGKAPPPPRGGRGGEAQSERLHILDRPPPQDHLALDGGGVDGVEHPAVLAVGPVVTQDVVLALGYPLLLFFAIVEGGLAQVRFVEPLSIDGDDSVHDLHVIPGKANHALDQVLLTILGGGEDNDVSTLDVVEDLEDHDPLVLLEAGLHAPAPDFIGLGYVDLEEKGDEERKENHHQHFVDRPASFGGGRQGRGGRRNLRCSGRGLLRKPTLRFKIHKRRFYLPTASESTFQSPILLHRSPFDPRLSGNLPLSQ